MIEKRKKWNAVKYPLWFIFPGLILYIVFFIIPTVGGFFYSVTDWSSIKGNEISFVGMRKFIEVLKKPDFGTSFKNTLTYSFSITIFKNIFALALALALNEKLRSRNTLRAIYFSPAILNAVAVGLIFQGLLNQDTGFVNNFFKEIGLDFLALGWLDDPRLAIHCASIIEIWRATGIAMAIYLTGLQTIPKDYYEAATIDGAGFWQKLKSITLPLLASSITINVLLSLVYGFRTFEVIYFLTGGGPGPSSQVLMTLAYRYMGMGLYGYSAAINVILVLLNCIISIPILLYLCKKEVEM